MDNTPVRRCFLCEHPWHYGLCGLSEHGGPLSSSYSCLCPEGVELDEIDAALYSIRQNIPHWDKHYLKLLADLLGREIPDLPSRAEARVHGRRRHDG